MQAEDPASTLSVANFNIHAGIDGWGQPFDALAACKTIDADILVLPEAWAPEGEEPLAHRVASAGGYDCVDAGFYKARMWLRDATRPMPPNAGWGPPLWPILSPHSLRYTGRTELRKRASRPPEPGAHPVNGQWGLSLLSRLPILRREIVDLPRLPTDRVPRKAIAVEVAAGRWRLRVVGTHLSHLEMGSPVQMRFLHRRYSTESAAVCLLGDMNSWTPPLRVFLPGWRHAVRGPTWPARRPRHQIDHVLVRGGVEIVCGEVLEDFGSDHRPVRARLRQA